MNGRYDSFNVLVQFSPLYLNKSYRAIINIFEGLATVWLRLSIKKSVQRRRANAETEVFYVRLVFIYVQEDFRRFP